MTKIGVCLSSNGMCHSAFAISLALVVLSAAMKGVQCVLIGAESALNMVNRENAVDKAKGVGCSHVLFLDSDMTFPNDLIYRLLFHDKDVVGGMYVHRFPPFHILGRLVSEYGIDVLSEAIELPGGCLLIKMSVFDKLKAPYFRCVAMESADGLPPDVGGFDLSRYEYPGTMSEDFYFCQSARRAGFQVWADLPLSMEVSHYGMGAHKIPSGEKVHGNIHR